MAELHSIAGLFNEEFTGIKPFGGFVFVDGNKIEEGLLVDVYGRSSVSEGVIDNKKLEFFKTYLGDEGEVQNHQPINYKFRFENGIWKGEYKMVQYGKTGRAMCKTGLCFGGLEFKVHRYPGGPEGWARYMMDQMIASGHLKVVKDEKTGEEYIMPSET